MATASASMLTPALQPKPPPTYGAITCTSVCENPKALAIRLRCANGDCELPHRVILPFSETRGHGHMRLDGHVLDVRQAVLPFDDLGALRPGRIDIAFANLEVVGDIGARFRKDEVGDFVFAKLGMKQLGFGASAKFRVEAPGSTSYSTSIKSSAFSATASLTAATPATGSPT